MDLNLKHLPELIKKLTKKCVANLWLCVSAFDERLKEKREEIANRPMFTGSNNSSPSVTSNSTQQLVKQLVARKQTSTFAGGEKTLTVGSLGIVRRRSHSGISGNSSSMHSDVPRTNTSDKTAAENGVLSISFHGDNKLVKSDNGCTEKKDCGNCAVTRSVKDEVHDGPADRGCLKTIVSAYGSSSSNDSDSA